jgi:hypothetical protein
MGKASPTDLLNLTLQPGGAERRKKGWPQIDHPFAIRLVFETGEIIRFEVVDER